MRSIGTSGAGHAHLQRTQAQTWKGFEYKAEVLAALLEAQYHLCCYSELRADQLGLGYHIEHLENRSQNPARTFDPSNLAASALHKGDLHDLKRQGHETFGGHAPQKQKDCEMDRFVSCRQPDCQRYFAYLSDGRVVPQRQLSPEEQDRAQYTITLLNLNCAYLVSLRRAWWDELDELWQEHEAQGWSLPHLAAVDLVPRSGQLSRFFSLTRQFYGTWAEAALQEHAPELV